MRLEFDAKVSRLEQLERYAKAKQPGRKHNKRPGVRASERARQRQKQLNALSQSRRKERNAKVAAYWRGELDEHPK